ncbi:mevalonate kinase [Agromyces atrinae]|nr:mevalonate kinase [Agromyces atrinae]MCI2957417.1 mevalonate kinase [Agromyces atrinae]NYD67252.1 mevalonate kinase [Agromyces atrinae]
MTRSPSGDGRRAVVATETGGIRTIGSGYGSAHAKFILLGEHAVVHARPAIGMPLPHLRVRAEARIAPGPLRLETEIHSGPLSAAPPRLDALGTAIRTALAHFGHPEDDITVGVRSGIPIGRGLGSSAAAAHAIIEAIRSLLEVELDDDERFEIVQAAERIAHGNPSGLDARATREPGPILFESGAVTRLDVRFGGAFVIADTGIRGSTKDAVDDVGAFVRVEPVRSAVLLDRLEALTRDAAVDLASDRRGELGERMTEAQRILTELGAGHEAIDRLVDAARRGGALGAKLTGGGQGGCIVALVRSADDAQPVVRALEEAGAVGSWVVTHGGQTA